MNYRWKFKWLPNKTHQNLEESADSNRRALSSIDVFPFKRSLM